VLKNNNKLWEKPTTIYTENTSKITTEILQRLFDKEIQTDNLKEKQKFLDYWTEKNTDAKKERWQKQQAFDVKRRWKTWLDNCKEWGKEEKKKPYYFGDPVVEKFGKKYVIVDGE
jgi:HD superfamily phosphohydrolase